MDALTQILVLFLLLLIGYICKRLNLISNEMNRDVTNLIFYVALPSLVISSLSSYSFSMEMLVRSGKLMVISMGVYGLSIGMSYMVPRILGETGTTRDILQFMIVFSNVGFMGYPVVNAVFGSKGVFYTALYNLPFNILIWTFGVMVLSRPQREKSSKDQKFMWVKELLNPGIVSAAIGFIMFLTSTKLPGPISTTFELLGNITTPLCMIFVGSILADMEAKKVFTNSKVFLGSLVRLVILPIMVLFFLRFFDLDPIMLGIPVIITAMPVAANCAIMATKYGNDYYLGSQAVFISTILSMITIPFIVTLL